MNIKKQIQLLLLIIMGIAITGCNGQNSKLEAFKKQKYRFEVRGCKFYYNEQEIELYKPKSYYANIFGDNFFKENWHKEIPLLLKITIRSLKRPDIKDVTNIRVMFEGFGKEEKEIGYRKLPYFKQGEYVLIDGIPFGHDVPFKELNKTLIQNGKQAFADDFAGSSGIKARGHGECDNLPQFFISYNKEGKLERLSYLIHKPKNLN